MYPLKFESLYYEKIWGGRDLEKFKNDLPQGDIGESWDVACHSHGMSIVSNGEYKGKKLDELIELLGAELLGTKISKEWFPLLVKLISAQDKLSVQVHPDDEYAREVEGDMGKTEAWYIVDAKDGAGLILGNKECTKEEFRKALEDGDFEKYLNKVEVKKGDVYFVKSGLLHAICEGVVIAEIQQNSDTTYRVFDYNRGREIHVDKALDVVDLSLKPEKSKGLKVQCDGYDKTYLCLSENFSLEKYEVYKSCRECSDLERFSIFTCVDGNGSIKFKGGVETIELGESILIPATMGEYTFEGNITMVKSYVPNVEKVEKEILEVVTY